LPSQPPNVKTEKWLPQQAILGNMAVCSWEKEDVFMSRLVEWLYRKFNRIKLHFYFHNFEPFIWLHAMKYLWVMSCPIVQFTSKVSQTVC
jgi:hypothetical protein